MALVNENFLKLPVSYLFTDIARKVNAFRVTNPDADIIRLGIGDVTQPLAPAVIAALHKATDEMASEKTFRGYGPEHGYEFLREAIIKNDFQPRGIHLDPMEVFINDGAKSDTGNIGDILGLDNTLCMTDPIYPVYVDSNAMCGRAGTLTDNGWSNIIYCPCNAENNFTPALPDQRVDVIYLCYPNNPTSAMATREQLKAWVDYANANGSVILYDSAYEVFISEKDIPHTIFEIEGARTCAIEFRSFSKTAGFTGNRCAYTVVPMELERDGASLNKMWNRRQCTKFNGVPYVVQRGAEAVYTPEGHAQIMESINYYRENARVIREGLSSAGFTCYGGVNAPYIWLKAPNGMGSWDFFDLVLDRANVATTPGAGFGPSGEGFVRLTAFGNAEATKEAVERVKSVI